MPCRKRPKTTWAPVGCRSFRRPPSAPSWQNLHSSLNRLHPGSETRRVSFEYLTRTLRVPAAGLIVEGAYTSLADRGQELYPFFPIKLLATQRFPSLDRIPSIGMPKLFLHSPDDAVIPYAHGRRLFEAARSRTFFVVSRPRWRLRTRPRSRQPLLGRRACGCRLAPPAGPGWNATSAGERGRGPTRHFTRVRRARAPGPSSRRTSERLHRP